MNDTT